MSEYTSYDFNASWERAGAGDPKHVHLAWGYNGDFAEWSGGFIVETQSGAFVVIYGWCDTTGWGCQDGAESHVCLTLDQAKEWAVDHWQETFVYGSPYSHSSKPEGEPDWDKDPSDLNHEIGRKWAEYVAENV